MTLHRRDFLKSGLVLGAGAFAAPYVLGADKSRKYRTALIGTGWWGMNILSEAMQAGQSKVVALCDVDPNQLAVAADELGGMSSDTPNKYGDFREMFDKEQIEIAIIATPDHWHALQSIAALKHGAHVFIEKPTGHTIQESRSIVNAAHNADRIVQVGLHRRIGPHHVSGMEFLKTPGNLGKVGMVKMFVHGSGGHEAPSANAEPPSGMNWDMYCGPAPLRPYNRKIHPGGFRNFLDFANGQLGDWGVHWLDQLLWWSDGQSPRKIYSTGGRPIAGEPILTEKEQTSDAPDHQVAVYEFENFTATWEHQRFGGTGADQHPFGCYFYGENGVFHMGWRDGWTFYPRDGKKAKVHQDPKFDNIPDGHNVTMLWRNFLDAIESGKKPVADAEIGHRATTLSLLGMLSYKLGRSIEWDGTNEQIPGDAEANKLLRRDYRGEWVYPTV
ncbi:Gfo/Idh/MocA family oxidoreductase [Planctomicrobium piriforme]|uniref:Predicted dehydrogenase n=1 Tax=Planctomicrobium piriforme TaxID=1576369 RepID=A0A1I3P4T1_9PLAN|nr:Gfo/Idh/MocA family oxidoreductase [Planctomicrobium piriforme]SFJ16412.1 Predicted dehydrogenase [Planctomicrobium piriforme]